MGIETKLIRLKEKIAQAKTSKAEAEGALKQLKIELEREHDCKTVKAAERKLEKMDAQIEKLNNQVADGLHKLEQDYEL